MMSSSSLSSVFQRYSSNSITSEEKDLKHSIISEDKFLKQNSIESEEKELNVKQRFSFPKLQAGRQT